MKNFISRFAGKKIILISAMLLFLPLLAGAATLNAMLNVGTVYPVSGGTTNISGSCGTAASYSAISLALIQNGISTTLPTVMTTDTNGSFTGTITFPSSYGAGSATLVATCNRTGDTINSPTLTFAVPASSSFGLPAYTPSQGGIFNLSGLCGPSNGIGTAVLTLNSFGNNYALGTANLTQTATFSYSVTIPQNAGVGKATFKAACSNGNTITSATNIGSPAVNLFAFGSGPLPGQSTSVSGSCANASTNQNGTVSFSLLRNGAITNLPGSNNFTNNNSTFNSSVFFPSSVGSDPATFVVACPNGATFSNVIMLGAMAPVVVSTVNMPTGGVAAGHGQNSTFNYLVLAENQLPRSRAARYELQVAKELL
ncbi:MAG: hypothetical protein P4L74_04365 [Candidatus Doudnabacteria bacterium]|nr:hypothetical protein [Candidatus Doudnabacteria bacterium]